MTQEEDAAFESEVRRIARIRFDADTGGAEIEDGRERDGVFITDEAIHVVEATTSAKKEKAEKDIEKIRTLLQQLRKQHPYKAQKGWFVTKDDPTAHQREVLKDSRYSGLVDAVSLHHFASKIVDGKEYIALRRKHAFGSARDPINDGVELNSTPLLQTKMLTPDGDPLHEDDIARRIIESNDRFVVLGDYGAGKSVAMRQLFLELSKPFIRGDISRFPVLLNLAEHNGQQDPVEALERHARSIGYSNPSHLVRAWRAGQLHLLLDGFDEVSTAVWAVKSTKLRSHRRLAMELVRRFISSSQQGTSIVISGRPNFFDSRKEMTEAMQVNGFTILDIPEFDLEQIRKYLSLLKLQTVIPDWVPTRPLLLSYLIARKMLEEVLATSAEVGAASGWDLLLDKICERECKVEPGLDASSLREFLERIATMCRATPDGVGPIPLASIVKTFEEVCGYQPTESSYTLIQRMPGLGVGNEEDGSRRFIDRDLAAAASGGDLFRYTQNPYHSDVQSLNISNALQQLGIEVCAVRISRSGMSIPGLLRSSWERAQKTPQSPALLCDVFRLSLCLGVQLDLPKVTISEISIPFLDLQENDASPISFNDCIISTLVADRGLNTCVFPKFNRCLIALVEGRFGEKDLPQNIFDGCSFEDFGENNQTSAAILESQLALPIRVLLVCLRKLFFQRGSGRKESSFVRGVDHRAQQHVANVLHILRRNGFVAAHKAGGDVLLIPMKSHRKRASKILSHPETCGDPVLAEALDA